MNPTMRIFIVCFLLLAFIGCEESPRKPRLPQGVPYVVATLPPFHGWAAELLKGVTTPALLMQGARAGHHSQLRPSDIKRLQWADVIVWGGPALEPDIARVLETLQPKARVIRLDQVPKLRRMPRRQAGHDHYHAQVSEDAGVTDKKLDPHYWLDPHHNARWIVHAMADALVEAIKIPPLRMVVRQNEEAVISDLVTLHQQMRIATKPFRQAPLTAPTMVGIHDATLYLEARYGVRVSLFLKPSHEVQTSVQAIKNLQEKAASATGACLLREPGYSLQGVVEEGALPAIPLDLMGAETATGQGFYRRVMEKLIGGVQNCLRHFGHKTLDVTW